jgi:biotin operon repressor
MMNKNHIIAESKVLESLHHKHFVTKQVLLEQTGLSRNNLDNAIGRLIDEGRIESARFKHSKAASRPEVAYMAANV